MIGAASWTRAADVEAGALPATPTRDAGRRDWAVRRVRTVPAYTGSRTRMRRGRRFLRDDALLLFPGDRETYARIRDPAVPRRRPGASWDGFADLTFAPILGPGLRRGTEKSFEKASRSGRVDGQCPAIGARPKSAQRAMTGRAAHRTHAVLLRTREPRLAGPDRRCHVWRRTPACAGARYIFGPLPSASRVRLRPARSRVSHGGSRSTSGMTAWVVTHTGGAAMWCGARA